MIIKNLTNSPFDLIDHAGQKVRIPARGTVDIEPHPMHSAYYRQVGYFEITENENPAPVDDLRERYESMTGEAPDGRWSKKRLAEELAKLEG